MYGPVPLRVAVVGGAGAVGRMMSEQFDGAGASVAVIDIVAPRSDARVQSILGDIAAPSPEVLRVLRTADIVLLALPESAALAAVALMAELATADTLVVDTLSVKSRISKAFRDFGPTGQAVGVNPMFAPSLPIPGRVVAAVVYNDGPRVAQFLAMLGDWGARVVRVGAEQHDRVVAATQALTHAAVLSFGLALKDLGVRGEPLAAGPPPPHSVSLALLARVTLGEPSVYWEVQAANPFAQQARTGLARAVAQLTAVAEHGSESEFAQLMEQAREPLGSTTSRYGELCAELFESIGPAESAVPPSNTESAHRRQGHVDAGAGHG